MAQKSKAGGAPKKAKPKTKTEDEKQFERFIETARELDIEEGGEAFEKALREILSSKNQKGPAGK